MEAYGSNFSFLNIVTDFYEIPFFQRGYVWEESNWNDLYEDLLDDNSDHFLGSVIIRQKECSSGNQCNFSIIDGQQRLITISILARVIYDTYTRYKQLKTNEQNLLEQQLATMFIHWTEDEQGQAVLKPVIQHSLVDAPHYEKVILNGLTGEEMEEIVLDSEVVKEKNQKRAGKSKDSNILKCYKYFYYRVNGNLATCDLIKKLICGTKRNMIVKIDLKENENEQAIFDTINTAGVRLTCADTIKNSIFQKAMENANSEEIKNYIINTYKKTWEDTFSSSDEDVDYWNTEIQVGRYKRNNIEILFQSIALVIGIYDPEKDPLYKIPVCYKNYLTKLIKDAKDNQKSPVDIVLDFVKEIIEFAEIYRNCFYVPNEESTYTYNDPVKRLFNILTSRGITALHPYILKLFKDANVKTIDGVNDKLAQKLKKVEVYIVRSIVCGESTKNLNKECPILIKGDVTLDDYIKDKNLNDRRFAEGLKTIKENNLGKLLLFWIELYKQYNDKKSEKKALYFTFTLEHVMPQNWEDFWGIDVLPVINTDTREQITDDELAAYVRTSAVYELGNMALLSGNLNSAISNYEFSRKIEGDPNGKMKNKDGIRKYATLSTTTDVVKVYDDNGIWNEIEIRKRTKEFMKDIILIWPIDAE